MISTTDSSLAISGIAAAWTEISIVSPCSGTPVTLRTVAPSWRSRSAVAAAGSPGHSVTSSRKIGEAAASAVA